MKPVRTLILLSLFPLACGPAAAQSLALAPHLASNMVLQQGQPAEFRGTARAGETVTVDFAGTQATATAAPDGRWRAVLPAPRPGSAGKVTIRAGAETITLANVAAGDVWLCSGQSNMDLPISSSANPDRTAREGAGQPIRILKLRRTATAAPRTGIDPEIPWSVASPQVLAGFSAACWHMARALVAGGVKGPIGLVQASWGGTTIEDWMPPAALRAAGTPDAQLALLDRYARDPAGAAAQLLSDTDDWAARADPGSRPGAAWSDPSLDDRAWPSMAVPGQWERSGVKGLGGFDGVMWYRRIVTLTAAQARGAAHLRLGRIDERDRAWVNGVAVGASIAAADMRDYAIPAGVLREGANVIAVRVIDEMGGGGFSSPAQALVLSPGDGSSVPLAGEWRYRIGIADSGWPSPPPFVPWATPRGLAMAWNGMIAPLAGMRLRGIAWYQGESNTARAATYPGLLAAWRAAWREQFGDPMLPVVLVQLPGYGPPAVRPQDNPWARTREAQRQAALGDARTGLAIAIDLGIATDIHPAHKSVVGERMAKEALRVAYGKAEPVAPQPRGARRAGDTIVVDFSPADSDLQVHGSAEPTAFEICARSACRFARARLAGRTVVIDAGPEAVDEVRYAWQGSPPINLYARSGLPVSPFRMRVPSELR